MKSRALLLLTTLILIGPPALLAQDDEEGRFALGVAAGMLETEHGPEPYLTASLRIRAGYTGEGDEPQGSITGYIEPEVAWWNYETSVLETSDLLVGVNIGGAVRLRAIEYFLGAGVGYHFLEESRISALDRRSADDGAAGVNAHFGIDIRMSQRFSLYGVGRFDLVDVKEASSFEGEQVKAYLGGRYRF
jgi:hypothetical protein